MFKDLVVRKPMDQLMKEASNTRELKRAPGPLNLTTLGEIFAWIIGWDLMLDYLFGASTVAVGWSGYVVSFFQDFGITIPSYYPMHHSHMIRCSDGKQRVHS